MGSSSSSQKRQLSPSESDQELLASLIRDRSKTKTDVFTIHAMIVPDNSGIQLGLNPIKGTVERDPHTLKGGHIYYALEDVLISRKNGDILCIVEPACGAFQTYTRLSNGTIRYKTSCVNVLRILSLKRPETFIYLENYGADVRMDNDLAFRYAVTQKHLEVIQYMVKDQGVNPEYLQEHGKDPYTCGSRPIKKRWFSCSK